MFRPTSDLSERLPLYHQVIQDTQRAVDDGVAEGVDPAIFERLAGVFPVGVQSDGSLEVPRGYNPSVHMPLLVLAPTEARDIIVQPYLQATFNHLAKRKVMKVHLNEVPPPSIDISYIAEGLGVSNVIDSSRINNLSERSNNLWVLPGLAIVRLDQEQPDNNALALVHEGSHWEYMCRIGRIVIEGDVKQTLKKFAVAAERPAYGSTYRMEHNMGRYKHLLLPEDILTFTRDDDDPADFGRHASNMKYIDGSVGINQRIPRAILAAAFTLRYADPVTGGVTDDEVAAYAGGGLVHAL